MNSNTTTAPSIKTFSTDIMVTSVLEADEKALSYAKDLILSENLVAFPTETVYGLGGLGTSDNAVQAIYRVKGRPQDNPLIAHVHRDFDIESLIYLDRTYAHKIISAFMPGPITIVGKSRNVVCKRASCGLDTLAVRNPDHKVAQAFLKCVNAPVVAPSANVSKHTSPVTSAHVYKDFNGKIPLILEGGKCRGGIESTVVNVMGEVPVILRTGLVTREMIASVAGDCRIADGVKESDKKILSPGMKYTHYRPLCDAVLFDYKNVAEALQKYRTETEKGKKVFFLCDEKTRKLIGNVNVLSLGETAEDMAANLYFRLREGEEKADLIIGVMPEGEGGVFDGVKNRLRKACI